MTKQLRYILLSCLCAPQLLEAATATSQSFYSLRPNFQTAMPERVSLFRNELLEECQGFGGALEVVAYGGKTTKEGRAKLARFFLPPGCATVQLRVLEYNPNREATIGNTDDGNPLKDLEARHFNIRTINETFSSIISIMPEQSVIGVGLAYKQTITAKADGSPGLWFGFTFPIERVMNRMNLSETILDDGGGPRDELGLDDSPRVGTMVDALSQCTWHYGQILQDECTETGIADLEFKLGYNTFNCETCGLNSFVTLVVPTGTKVRGRTVFEPIVGNNHHFGFSLGTAFAYEVWCKGPYLVKMCIDNNTRYLFSNHQIRSFDLIGKPWGRYMETYDTSEQAAQASRNRNQNSGTSGINVFTQCVRVSPHLAGTFNTAILIARTGNCTSWLFEGGYNLFVRQGEVLDFECSNRISRAALKAVNGEGRTTLARTIKDNYPRSEFTLDQRYAAVSNCDINIESASMPATISNTIYGSIGYRWERECPWFLAAGGSYEFSTSDLNVAPERWLLWGKFGVTF